MNVLDRGAEAYRAGDLDAAERLFRETIAHASHNLGVIAVEREDEAGAESHLRAAAPLLPEAAFSLALLLLQQGRYPEAWPLHEQRRSLPRLKLLPPPAGIPEWRGEPLAGRRLLVLGEQGQGDQIMFARYLPVLAAQGAKPVYFCAASVAPLLPGARASFGADEWAGFDAWIYAGSLPLRLGTTVATIPPPLPLRRGHGGGGIGVMTRGRPEFANDAHRSLDAATAGGLLRMGCDLHPEATGARDFAETAAIIEGLDLVITVDTAVAHLAGSMGKPTWILLPRRFTDWRWLRHRAASPWYPSARLFRQQRSGEWGQVLAEIRNALAQL